MEVVVQLTGCGLRFRIWLTELSNFAHGVDVDFMMGVDVGPGDRYGRTRGRLLGGGLLWVRSFFNNTLCVDWSPLLNMDFRDSIRPGIPMDGGFDLRHSGVWMCSATQLFS